MPEITCGAIKCAYNDDGYCEREGIRIDVEDEHRQYSSCTCCDSFEEKGCGADCGCENCAGENASVECFATDCIYNENRECIADSISVDGREAGSCTETCCDTFRRSSNR